MEQEKLISNKNYLETEKQKLIEISDYFIERLSSKENLIGRPRRNIQDVLKSLLLMSYNGFSYRRSRTDFKQMYELGYLKSIIPRSTLNDYANNPEIKEILDKLVQLTGMFFRDEEDTLIMDSTWLSHYMYVGGHKKVYQKDQTPFERVTKLNVACLKNSKIIIYAVPTPGNKNDYPMFEILLRKVVNNGFRINTILADAGYSSKQNYALCQELGIYDVYLDFRYNVTPKRAKNLLYRESLYTYRNKPHLWHEKYRYRVLVEGIFSSIKRKSQNYLRSRTETSRHVELLLKVLVHNFEVIGKYTN